MKKLTLLIFLLCFSLFVSAQDEKPKPQNGWDWRVEKPEKSAKELRKEKMKELEEDFAKHFVTPQGKWYFGITGGYAVPFLTVNRRNIEDYLGTSDYFETEAGEISNKTVVTNDGGGLKASIYAGYSFNQFVSGELNVTYNEGKRTLQGRIVSPNYNSELVTRGRSIALNPQIVLSTPSLGRFKFVGKFGFYVPVWVDGKGAVNIDDRNGTFLKSIATGSDRNLYNLADAVAEFLGENVDGLGFLEDGFFHAAGYHFTYKGDADIDFRIDQNAIGFSGSIGLLYQATPLLSIFAEVKNGGFNITTRNYELKNIEGTLDLFGERNYVVINSEGATVDGTTFIPAEELEFLTNVNYHYTLNETHNNEVVNPNGVDPSKALDRLAIRRSVFDASFNISLQFNFLGKKGK